jgi:predicted ABC-type ATPase
LLVQTELERVRLPPETLAISPRSLSWTPDAFANTLRSSGTGISTIAAGKEVLRLAKEHLKQKESFAVETLSGKNYLQMMQYARGIDRGFEVVLIYIGTESVEINLARIAKRVLAGGHNVPEMDVRRRYLRSLQNLPAAAEIADRVLLFDNSNDLGYQLVGLVGRELHQWFHPQPVWACRTRDETLPGDKRVTTTTNPQGSLAGLQLQSKGRPSAV